MRIQSEKDSPSKVGWISAAIMAGTQIFGGLLGGQKGSGEARGLAAITSAGAAVISQMQSAVSTGNCQQAAALADSLSNPAAFYQAQKGKDAAKLNEYKQQAAQLMSQCQTRLPATSGGSGSGKIVLPNGEIVDISGKGSQWIDGVDNSVVLLGAVGLAAVMMLRK